jgi:hypothetical protein
MASSMLGTTSFLFVVASSQINAPQAPSEESLNRIAKAKEQG